MQRVLYLRLSTLCFSASCFSQLLNDRDPLSQARFSRLQPKKVGPARKTLRSKRQFSTPGFMTSAKERFHPPSKRVVDIDLSFCVPR